MDESDKERRVAKAVQVALLFANAVVTEAAKLAMNSADPQSYAPDFGYKILNDAVPPVLARLCGVDQGRTDRVLRLCADLLTKVGEDDLCAEVEQLMDDVANDWVSPSMGRRINL